jgi:hypothetical protein
MRGCMRGYLRQAMLLPGTPFRCLIFGTSCFELSHLFALDAAVVNGSCRLRYGRWRREPGFAR